MPTRRAPQAILAVVGGAVGALYNALVLQLNVLRRVVLGNDVDSRRRGVRVAEVMVLTTMAFATAFGLPFLYGCVDCPEAMSCGHGNGNGTAAGSGTAASSGTAAGSGTGHGGHHHLEYVRFNCPVGQHNELASLLHSGQEGLIKHLYVRTLGDDPEEWLAPTAVDPHAELGTPEFGADWDVMLGLLGYYFVASVVLFGVALPSGNFIPGMAIGALLGRLHAKMLISNGLAEARDAGVYALMGSAAVLGGMTRMTLTLTVILVEVTQDISLLPPLMLALAISRAVGDALTPSFDDVMMWLLSLPYLPEEPPHVLEVLTAQDVMSSGLVTLREQSTVGEILRVLETPHNGFPVLGDAAGPTSHLVCGMILRRQLNVILEERVWLTQEACMPYTDAVIEAYVSSYANRHRYRSEYVGLAEAAASLTRVIDLRPFMDSSPLLVAASTPLTRV